MNNSAKILAGIVAGIAAGVIIGVLLAPDKGSETRKKITDEGKKLATDLKEKFNKGKERFCGLKDEIDESLKEKVKDFA